jgi:hypothetical protein
MMQMQMQTEQLRIQNEVEARKDQTKLQIEQMKTQLAQMEMQVNARQQDNQLYIEQQKMRADWEKFQRNFGLELQRLQAELSDDRTKNDIKTAEVAIKAQQAAALREKEPQINMPTPKRSIESKIVNKGDGQIERMMSERVEVGG